MSLAVIAYQLVIFVTIIIAGDKYKGLATIFWCIFTVVNVYLSVLFLIQFLTIYVAYNYVANKKQH